MEGDSSMTLIVSMAVGSLSVMIFLVFYLSQKRNEVKTVAELPHDTSKRSKPPPPNVNVKKVHHDKTHGRRQHQHHQLDLNTLKGHGDAVSYLCFSPNAQSLATACEDRVVRVYKVDNASSKSFKFLRINMPSGKLPVAVAFCKDASELVVGAENITGASLCMYGDNGGKAASEGTKIPLPEVKWEQKEVHGKKAIISLFGTSATYGSADGSTIIVSSSEGTDIKLWHGHSGRCLGSLDTNQLKNHMATISSNGRFIAAAAFTADVKVWEIVYGKDGSVKETSRAMQLKGHKSAVTWLCFTSDSERILTASKDGTMRVWNINVRYHLEEDPKCLKIFPIPLHDEKGLVLPYDRLSLSPDDKIVAATHGSLLQWLSFQTGKVLDTADNVHDGDITCMTWSPKPVPTDSGMTTLLATASVDKKVKFWAAPKLRE